MERLNTAVSMDVVLMVWAVYIVIRTVEMVVGVL